MSNIVTTDLAELAAEANQHHAAAQDKARQAVDHAMTAGALLLQAKAAIGHGAWAAWLQRNFKGSDRTARGYMRLANHREAIEAKRQRVADLSLREAIAALAEPKEAPDPKPSWKDRTPEENAKTVEQWPDLLDAPTRLYMADGMSASDVAEIMGVPVDLVELRMYPNPPIRVCDGERLNHGDLARYQAYLKGYIDFHHAHAYMSAANLAKRERPELERAMQLLSERYFSERRRGPQSPYALFSDYARQLPETRRMRNKVNAIELMLDMAALADYRAAIGWETVDRNPDLWSFASGVLKLGDALQLVRH